MKKLHTIFCAAALATAAFAAGAQPTYRVDPGQEVWTPRIDERQARQEARIRDGLANGEITHREARRLFQLQREIRQAERMAKADGVVTRDERRELMAMLDRADRQIFRQKHDQQYRDG